MYGPRDESLISSTSSSTTTTVVTEEPENMETTTSTTEISRVIPDEKPNLCKDSKIDAITTLEDKSVYVFKGI